MINTVIVGYVNIVFITVSSREQYSCTSYQHTLGEFMTMTDRRTDRQTHMQWSAGLLRSGQ